MRASFSLTNTNQIRSYFKHAVEFLDFYVTDERVFIISNQRDFFYYMEFPLVDRSDIEERSFFRVERAPFLDFIRDGILSVHYLPELKEIELKMETVAGSEFTMSRPYQDSDIVRIQNNLNILRSAGNGKATAIKLHKVAPVLRTLGSFNPVLTIKEGEAIAMAQDDSVWVYCLTECGDLEILNSHAKFLMDNCDNIFAYQNYIFGRSENRVILVQQMRIGSESNLDYVKRQKSEHIIHTKMVDVCQMVARFSNDHVVHLNFERGEALLSSGRTKYRTRFTVSEEEKKSSSSIADIMNSLDDVNIARLPSITLPIRVINDIVANSDHKRSVVFYIKKNFIQIEIGNSIIAVIRRQNYEPN